MEPSLVQELRTNFFQKVSEENRDFHPKDLTRVNNDSFWLKRFLLHHDFDMKDALNMLLDTCEWRKSYKVNEINEQTVNIDYLNEGGLFIHNRDKDGKSLLIFKCKKHVKGQKEFEDLKKIVVYWFERLERLDKGDQMTIFFDMADTGFANLDMDYTKYLINLCKLYYPYFLNYILIFEMPWMLNTAFKIIKTWLPTKAVEKIKFVNKSTLKEFVDADQALTCWGGTDNYEFTFVPDSDVFRNEEIKKKVHFADGSPLLENVHSGFHDGKQEDGFTSSKLKVHPPEGIIFNLDGIEMTGTLTITNVSETDVTFKVKTTSPEKFRVRPSCGILSPNNVAQINVMLQAGYPPSNILRDKFLVMSFPVEPNSSGDLNLIWKLADTKKVDQHRLKCMVTGLLANGSPTANNSQLFHSTLLQTSDSEMKISNLIIGINQVNKSLEDIHKDLRQTKILNWLTVFLIVVFAIVYYLTVTEKLCTLGSFSD